MLIPVVTQNVNQDLCNIRWMDKGREIDDITIKILSP